MNQQMDRWTDGEWVDGFVVNGQLIDSASL